MPVVFDAVKAALQLGALEIICPVCRQQHVLLKPEEYISTAPEMRKPNSHMRCIHKAIPLSLASFALSNKPLRVIAEELLRIELLHLEHIQVGLGRFNITKLIAYTDSEMRKIAVLLFPLVNPKAVLNKDYAVASWLRPLVDPFMWTSQCLLAMSDENIVAVLGELFYAHVVPTIEADTRTDNLTEALTVYTDRRHAIIAELASLNFVRS